MLRRFDIGVSDLPEKVISEKNLFKNPKVSSLTKKSL
jgi:hypothetical protein